jgi:hypothetical protein
MGNDLKIVGVNDSGLSIHEFSDYEAIVTKLIQLPNYSLSFLSADIDSDGYFDLIVPVFEPNSLPFLCLVQQTSNGYLDSPS